MKITNGKLLSVTIFGTTIMDQIWFVSSLATQMEAPITNLGVEATYPKFANHVYAMEAKQIFSNAIFRHYVLVTII